MGVSATRQNLFNIKKNNGGKWTMGVTPVKNFEEFVDWTNMTINKLNLILTQQADDIQKLKIKQKTSAKILCGLIIFNLILIIALAISGAFIAFSNENRVIDDYDDYLENQLEMEYLENLNIEDIE